MNAQTPLLPAEADAAHSLTVAMLQNAPVLRALLTRDVFSGVKELAELVGRDDSNLGKSLAILEEDGAIVRAKADGGLAIRLTDFGRQALQGFDFAEGRLALPVGFVIRTRRQLQPHALNPRKDWDSEEAAAALDEMRESIVMRGIRYPLEIRLNPADGEADWIVSGERRWRALGLAIDDLDMAEDYPIVCQVKDVDDEQHLILALEENVQRRNLSHLEEARAYAYLRDVRKWGTDRIAETFGGVSRKVVQNKLRLLEPQNAELAAKVERGDLTYHQALQAMIQPKAPQGESLFGGDLHQQKKGDEIKPLELTAKQALIVIELADRCEKQPHPAFDGYCRIAQMPPAGDGQRLLEKGIITVRSGMGQAFGKVMLHHSGAKRWLTDNGFYEDRGELLHKARTAIVGAEKAAQAEADGVYITDWLNVDDGAAAGPAHPLAPPSSPEEDLDPIQRLALVEIVVKAHEENVQSAPPGDRPVALTTVPAMTHPLLKSLYWGGYLAATYGPDYFPAVRYTDKAIAALNELDLNPLTRPIALRQAREATGMAAFSHDMLVMQEKYATDVLNAKLPEPEADLEEVVTNDVADKLAAQYQERDAEMLHGEGSGLPTGLLGQDASAGTAAEDDEDDREDDADEGRFAPTPGSAPQPAHVVPPSSQNLQAQTSFNRMVGDRLARDLAAGKPHWSTFRPEDLADVVIGSIEDGDIAGAGAAMAALAQHLAANPGHQVARALARHVVRANQEA